MQRVRLADPWPTPRPSFSRAQVARFIRRMTVVSEGEARLIRALETAEDVGPNASLVGTLTTFDLLTLTVEA